MDFLLVLPQVLWSGVVLVAELALLARASFLGSIWLVVVFSTSTRVFVAVLFPSLLLFLGWDRF